MALSKELLQELLESTASLLQDRVKDGTATPADISNALRLLKDNDISVIVQDSDALQELNQKLANRRTKVVNLNDAKEDTKESVFR